MKQERNLKQDDPSLLHFSKQNNKISFHFLSFLSNALQLVLSTLKEVLFIANNHNDTIVAFNDAT